MLRDDGRLQEAKLIPILEVAERLGIAGLRRAGRERVGACPICGGNDRFSINPDREVFHCRTCSAGGDGLALVQHAHSCDFAAAISFLVGDAVAQIDPAKVERLKQQSAEKEKQRKSVEAQMRARAIRDAREVWGAMQPGEGGPVADYLAGRGIRFKIWPPAIGYLPDHPYIRSWLGRSVEWFRGPCMIAGIQGPDNRVVAVHQTWFDPAAPGRKRQIVAPDGSVVDAKGKSYPAKLVRGSKKGGAIRLSPMTSTGVMVMGEGIETTASALTVNARPGAVYWAGVDLGNMSGQQERVPGKRNSGQPLMTDLDAWVPPDGISQLFFIRDGDSNAAATEAKLLSGLRRAMIVRPGLKGLIVDPGDGCDLNDVLIAQAAKDGGEPNG